MQATVVDRPFHHPGWIYEETVDGWRLIAYKDGARVQLLGHSGVDHTHSASLTWSPPWPSYRTSRSY
jgi:hypothetical protein